MTGPVFDFRPIGLKPFAVSPAGKIRVYPGNVYTSLSCLSTRRRGPINFFTL